MAETEIVLYEMHRGGYNAFTVRHRPEGEDLLFHANSYSEAELRLTVMGFSLFLDYQNGNTVWRKSK